MGIASLFDGIGGTVHGSFFRVDESVDTTQPPGTTKVQCPERLSEMLWQIVSGKAFFYSPNLSWFVLACLVWWVAPYNLQDSNRTWQDHLWERLLVNHLLAFGYVGFWHISLYWWHWGKRPFGPNRVYQWGKVLHNMFYTWLGVLQWTATEVAFLSCYQAGKIPFRHEHLSLQEEPALFWQTLLICILLPDCRSLHFYFAHRLIHAQFLYKPIHSLHHRNTDVEPFSGLCMHPLEHMMYYTSYLPCLFACWHPLIIFWMGVHLVISPAASHSGFEDHFNADSVHYVHHRYTDCNYGVPQSVPFDLWFGTYRATLKVDASSGDDDKTKLASVDPKARLGLIPDHPFFNGAWVSLWALVWILRNDISPWLGAMLVTIGPILLAWVAWMLTPASMRRRSFLAPFDKDPLWSQVLHFGGGLIMGVFPATYLVYLTLCA